MRRLCYALLVSSFVGAAALGEPPPEVAATGHAWHPRASSRADRAPPAARADPAPPVDALARVVALEPPPSAPARALARADEHLAARAMR